MSESQIDLLDTLVNLSRAKDAQPNWQSLPIKERVRRVSRLRPAIKRRVDDIVRVMKDFGRPEFETLSSEIMVALRAIKYYCRIAEGALTRPVKKDFMDHIFFPGKKGEVVYDPCGTWGMIPAWNNVFNFIFGDAPPCLLMGNTIIIKPSSTVPADLVSLMAEIVYDADLEDEFCIINGGPGKGSFLVENCDGIHFTGSTKMGMKIRDRCYERKIPFIGELGGFDPMIVFSDAQMDRAVNAAVWGRFANGGQNCNAVKIVYYVGSEIEALSFAWRVAEAAENIREEDLRPVVNEKEFKLLRGQLEDALDKDILCLISDDSIRIVDETVDAVEGPPWRFPPTVLFLRKIDKEKSLRVRCEETFGPILPIISVSSEEEVVQLVNESPYALSASVWTNDDNCVARLKKALDVGNICVRDVLVNYALIDLPFGGRRESGVGVRHGVEGLYIFGKSKSIFEAEKRAKKREDYWLPYGRRILPFFWTQEKTFRFLIKNRFFRRWF